MSTIFHDIDCYILAGGKSSRMGTEKGLIKIKEKTLIEYVLEKVKPLFKNCVIVSKNPLYEKFGLICIPDEVEEIGPAGGIYTALQHTRAKYIFIVSCDMPNIRTEAIKNLIDSLNLYQMVVPVFDTCFEPLFAIYSKSCAPKWKEIIDSGTYKLQNIISNFKVLELDVTKHPAFSKDLFLNLNTQHDLQNFMQKIKDGN